MFIHYIRFWYALLPVVKPAETGTPNLNPTFTNHPTDWSCETGQLNCCRYLKMMHSEDVWTAPPNNIVLRLKVKESLENNKSNWAAFVPEWSSINKVRFRGTPQERWEYQTLREGGTQAEGEFFIIVDEQISYMACVQSNIKKTYIHFQAMGCLSGSGCTTPP